MARKESPDTIRYYRIELPDSEKVYSYSAEKLQQKLNDLLMGQRIQGLPTRNSGSAVSLPSRLSSAYICFLPFCLSAFYAKRLSASGSVTTLGVPEIKKGRCSP